MRSYIHLKTSHFGINTQIAFSANGVLFLSTRCIKKAEAQQSWAVALVGIIKNLTNLIKLSNGSP